MYHNTHHNNRIGKFHLKINDTIWNGNIPKSITLTNTNQYMYRSSQHINNITSKHVLCTLQVLMELDRQTGSLHHKNNNSSNFA